MLHFAVRCSADQIVDYLLQKGTLFPFRLSFLLTYSVGVCLID